MGFVFQCWHDDDGNYVMFTFRGAMTNPARVKFTWIGLTFALRYKARRVFLQAQVLRRKNWNKLTSSANRTKKICPMAENQPNVP